MRWGVTAISSLLLLVLIAGCQESRLRDRTVMQVSTVNDLYYLQALNNLAMMYDSPGSIPYFALPSQGTNLRWLLDHNSAAFGGTTQNAETWQTAPTTNPDKIYLLKAVYWKTMGCSSNETEQVLTQFMQRYPSPFRDKYITALTPGWYGIGGKKDIPKDACYIGRHGKTYVWVLPQNIEQLSGFTLAIMDIVTASPKQGYTLFELKTKPNPMTTIANKLMNAFRDKISDNIPDTYESMIADLKPELDGLPPTVTDKVNSLLKKQMVTEPKKQDMTRKLEEILLEEILKGVPEKQKETSDELMNVFKDKISEKIIHIYEFMIADLKPELDGLPPTVTDKVHRLLKEQLPSKEEMTSKFDMILRDEVPETIQSVRQLQELPSLLPLREIPQSPYPAPPVPPAVP